MDETGVFLTVFFVWVVFAAIIFTPIFAKSENGHIFTKIGRAKMRYNRRLNTRAAEYIEKGVPPRDALFMARDDMRKV